MKQRWRPRNEIPAVTVGVFGELSSGIELVLSKNYLPVTLRVICKNVPQVSMTNKMSKYD
jgi:hypothetical protein